MSRRTSLAALALVALLPWGLTACGPTTDVTAASATPTGTGTAVSLPNGISLLLDDPVCTDSGTNQLCSINAYYGNGTGATVEIDATTTMFRDASGTVRSGTTQEAARTLRIEPGGRGLVLWSVTLPSNVELTEAVWTAPDGTTARALFLPPSTDVPTPTPSPTATPTAVDTPTPSTTPSDTASASASSSPTPSKTPTPTPTPSSAPPTGSVGGSIG